MDKRKKHGFMWIFDFLGKNYGKGQNGQEKIASSELAHPGGRELKTPLVGLPNISKNLIVIKLCLL